MPTIEESQEGGEERTRAPDGSRRSGDRRQLILLVEDNDADRDVYGGLLWYNGYDVIHAPDGETAIPRALDARPDLVLLDIRLTGDLTGLDVARRLRREGLAIPIVALSAVPREELGSAVEEAGITHYLEKPMDPFAVVKEVMRRVGYAGSGPRAADPSS